MNWSIPIIAVIMIAGYFLLVRLRGGKMASTEIVSDKIKAGARIIDVRTPGEYSEGAYPGAKNIPIDEIPSRLGEFGAKDKPIVLYCASGARSSQAAAYLRKNGYIDVVNAGGLHSMPR